MEKSLGADSTNFVEVPLDVVMAYYYRAKRQSSLLPMSQRLSWLESRDLEDRSDWVSRFRESSKTLGEVIKETCAARDAHWMPHHASGVTRSETNKQPSQPSATTTSQVSQFVLGKAIAGKKVARVMKDGTKLCAAFQHGQCKNKTPCPQGMHKCGVVTRGERVCGMPGHGAAQCRAKVSP